MKIGFDSEYQQIDITLRLANALIEEEGTMSRHTYQLRNLAGCGIAAILTLMSLCPIPARADGTKARIAVGTIEDKADGCNASKAKSLGEMLSNALENSDRFVITAEMDEVDGSGGQLPNVDIIVRGKVEEFEPDKDQGGMLGGLKKKAMDAIGSKSKSAEIKWELEIIDSHTGKRIEKFDEKAKSTDWSADASESVLSDEIGSFGELSTFAGEPMEDAINELLSKTVSRINGIVPGEYFKYSDDAKYASATASTGSEAQTSNASATGAPTAEGSGEVADDMQLFTKYDFVPGNKVLFYDDLSNEEVGEFPYRWNLVRGVFEIVKFGGDFWIMPTDEGTIQPKYPKAPFPEKYTVEFEFYDHGIDKTGNYYYLQWIDNDDDVIGEFIVYGKNATELSINRKTLSDKTLPQKLDKGVHTVRIMATDRSMKCYVDEVRVANVPKVEGFNPVGFQLRFRPRNDPETPTLVRNFRFAEGGKSMRDQLDETGRIVTHGILFDSGSWKIKGESYKTLKEIGELLSEDTSLRLSIEGHTDSDGDDAYNSDLSQKRAESVRSYLVKTYGVAEDRLEAKGWGETKPIDTNNTAEGKANNRRVELVKL